jgi:uncharacterized protein (TIGR03435 family)
MEYRMPIPLRTSRLRNRAAARTLAALLAIAAPPLSRVAAQQTAAAAHPAFEVVSIKPRGPVLPVQDSEGRWTQTTTPFQYTGGRLTVIQTLSRIIQHAYSISDWELEGPAWLKSPTYEVSAKIPSGAGRGAARLMLQQMLIDRFRLEFHKESRKVAGYALVVGPKGFTLTPAANTEDQSSSMQAGKLVSTGNLNSLTAVFMNYTDKPLVNLAGIDGIYHIELRWDADETMKSRHYDAAFWRALERASGLAIEKRLLDRDIMVVDRIDREPTAN